MARVLSNETPLVAVFLAGASKLNLADVGLLHFHVDLEKARIRDTWATAKVTLLNLDVAADLDLPQSTLMVKRTNDFITKDIRALSLEELHPVISQMLGQLIQKGNLVFNKIRVTSQTFDDPKMGNWYFLEVELHEEFGYRVVWTVRLHSGIMSEHLNMGKINDCIDKLLIGLDRHGIKLSMYERMPRILSMLLMSQLLHKHQPYSKEKLTFPGGHVDIKFTDYDDLAFFNVVIKDVSDTHISKEMHEALVLQFK